MITRTVAGALAAVAFAFAFAVPAQALTPAAAIVANKTISEGFGALSVRDGGRHGQPGRHGRVGGHSGFRKDLHHSRRHYARPFAYFGRPRHYGYSPYGGRVYDRSRAFVYRRAPPRYYSPHDRYFGPGPRHHR